MKTDIETSIERLRQERAALENSIESIGLHHGESWARSKASYVQLKRIGLWWSKFQFPPAGTRYTLAYDVAGAIDPELRSNGIRDATEMIFVRNVEDVPEGVPNHYVTDWVAGALRVLKEVETEY